MCNLSQAIQHDCESRQDKISRLKNQLAILKLGQNQERQEIIESRLESLEEDESSYYLTRENDQLVKNYFNPYELDLSVEASLNTSDILTTL